MSRTDTLTAWTIQPKATVEPMKSMAADLDASVVTLKVIAGQQAGTAETMRSNLALI